VTLLCSLRRRVNAPDAGLTHPNSAGVNSLAPPERGENSPNPDSRCEPQNRSRRRKEAEDLGGTPNPPPHVGGYKREVHGEGELVPSHPDLSHFGLTSSPQPSPPLGEEREQRQETRRLCRSAPTWFDTIVTQLNAILAPIAPGFTKTQRVFGKIAPALAKIVVIFAPIASILTKKTLILAPIVPILVRIGAIGKSPHPILRWLGA
jgi:hypothetical protein